MSDCVRRGGGGDTPSEPYLAAHHSILAHAKAVKIYREKYQQQQKGKIGMNCNTNFFLPYNNTNPEDLYAVEVSMDFSFGLYYNPLNFGDYPESMRKYITGDRLPKFTEEESELVKGSFDFIGVNHYTSNYVYWTGIPGVDFGNDSRCGGDIVNATGH